MPDQRKHRGPAPNDPQLFSAEQVLFLKAAVADLSWLLSRGYVINSSLKLVGDRYKLTARQRTAVSRSTCPAGQVIARKQKQLQSDEVTDQELWLDGYNVLISIEAGLSGGVLLRGQDGCVRDMASMHGSYRKVAETQSAILLIGKIIQKLNVKSCRWLLDQPVSNSGRLRALLLEIAEKNQWKWTVDLVPDPDPILAAANCCIASADSEILDRTGSWINLVELIVENETPDVWIVDLSR